MSNQVVLVSTDGDRFEVDVRVATQSELVKTLLADESDEPQEVPLPNVNSKVLAKVIEFCKHHQDTPMKELPKPLPSNDLKDCVDEWDAEFIAVDDRELLFELILATNYMDIKSLLDLACAQVAAMIKGKSPDQLRETFDIKEPFTPEEEAQIIEENKWCEGP